MTVLEKIDKYLSEGRSTTPKYVVDMKIRKGMTTPAAWTVKQHGKPTAKNLAKYVDAYNDSVMPGGVNQHLGDGSTATWAGIRENNLHASYIAEWGRK